jgi:hypothetical protein
MYRDEIWYRKLELALNERQDDFTDKQWHRFQAEYLLKMANRVRETSEACEICQSYQHTLTRLEEEFAELPDSKAQRQYQAEQLREMGKHFVKAHNLAPPRYFLAHWIRLGLIGGIVVGLVATIVIGNLLLFPTAIVLIGAAAAIYGLTLDQKYEREHRLI